MTVKIKLLNIKTSKIFIKEFQTEFEKDKFIRKLRYAKNIILINDHKDNFDQLFFIEFLIKKYTKIPHKIVEKLLTFYTKSV